jgi:hypothetical protein
LKVALSYDATIPNLIAAKFAGIEQTQDGCAMNPEEVSYLAH